MANQFAIQLKLIHDRIQRIHNKYKAGLSTEDLKAFDSEMQNYVNLLVFVGEARIREFDANQLKIREDLDKIREEFKALDEKEAELRRRNDINSIEFVKHRMRRAELDLHKKSIDKLLRFYEKQKKDINLASVAINQLFPNKSGDLIYDQGGRDFAPTADEALPYQYSAVVSVPILYELTQKINDLSESFISNRRDENDRIKNEKIGLVIFLSIVLFPVLIFAWNLNFWSEVFNWEANKRKEEMEEEFGPLEQEFVLGKQAIATDIFSELNRKLSSATNVGAYQELTQFMNNEDNSYKIATLKLANNEQQEVKTAEMVAFIKSEQNTADDEKYVAYLKKLEQELNYQHPLFAFLGDDEGRTAFIETYNEKKASCGLPDLPALNLPENYGSTDLINIANAAKGIFYNKNLVEKNLKFIEQFEEKILSERPDGLLRNALWNFGSEDRTKRSNKLLQYVRGLQRHLYKLQNMNPIESIFNSQPGICFRAVYVEFLKLNNRLPPQGIQGLTDKQINELLAEKFYDPAFRKNNEKFVREFYVEYTSQYDTKLANAILDSLYKDKPIKAFYASFITFLKDYKKTDGISTPLKGKLENILGVFSTPTGTDFGKSNLIYHLHSLLADQTLDVAFAVALRNFLKGYQKEYNQNQKEQQHKIIVDENAVASDAIKTELEEYLHYLSDFESSKDKKIKMVIAGKDFKQADKFIEEFNNGQQHNANKIEIVTPDNPYDDAIQKLLIQGGVLILQAYNNYLITKHNVSLSDEKYYIIDKSVYSNDFNPNKEETSISSAVRNLKSSPEHMGYFRAFINALKDANGQTQYLEKNVLKIDASYDPKALLVKNDLQNDLEKIAKLDKQLLNQCSLSLSEKQKFKTLEERYKDRLASLEGDFGRLMDVLLTQSPKESSERFEEDTTTIIERYIQELIIGYEQQKAALPEALRENHYTTSVPRKLLPAGKIAALIKLRELVNGSIRSLAPFEAELLNNYIPQDRFLLLNRNDAVSYLVDEYIRKHHFLKLLLSGFSKKNNFDSMKSYLELMHKYGTQKGDALINQFEALSENSLEQIKSVFVPTKEQIEKQNKQIESQITLDFSYKESKHQSYNYESLYKAAFPAEKEKRGIDLNAIRLRNDVSAESNNFKQDSIITAIGVSLNELMLHHVRSQVRPHYIHEVREHIDTYIDGAFKAKLYRLEAAQILNHDQVRAIIEKRKNISGDVRLNLSFTNFLGQQIRSDSLTEMDKEAFNKAMFDGRDPIALQLTGKDQKAKIIDQLITLADEPVSSFTGKNSNYGLPILLMGTDRQSEIWFERRMDYLFTQSAQVNLTDGDKVFLAHEKVAFSRSDEADSNRYYHRIFNQKVKAHIENPNFLWNKTTSDYIEKYANKSNRQAYRIKRLKELLNFGVLHGYSDEKQPRTDAVHGELYDFLTDITQHPEGPNGEVFTHKYFLELQEAFRAHLENDFGTRQEKWSMTSEVIFSTLCRDEEIAELQQLRLNKVTHLLQANYSEDTKYAQTLNYLITVKSSFVAKQLKKAGISDRAITEIKDAYKKDVLAYGPIAQMEKNLRSPYLAIKNTSHNEHIADIQELAKSYIEAFINIKNVKNITEEEVVSNIQGLSRNLEGFFKYLNKALIAQIQNYPQPHQDILLEIINSEELTLQFLNECKEKLFNVGRELLSLSKDQITLELTGIFLSSEKNYRRALSDKCRKIIALRDTSLKYKLPSIDAIKVRELKTLLNQVFAEVLAGHYKIEESSLSQWLKELWGDIKLSINPMQPNADLILSDDQVTSLQNLWIEISSHGTYDELTKVLASLRTAVHEVPAVQLVLNEIFQKFDERRQAKDSLLSDEVQKNFQILENKSNAYFVFSEKMPSLPPIAKRDLVKTEEVSEVSSTGVAIFGLLSRFNNSKLKELKLNFEQKTFEKIDLDQIISLIIEIFRVLNNFRLANDSVSELFQGLNRLLIAGEYDIEPEIQVILEENMRRHQVLVQLGKVFDQQLEKIENEEKFSENDDLVFENFVPRYYEEKLEKLRFQRVKKLLERGDLDETGQFISQVRCSNRPAVNEKGRQEITFEPYIPLADNLKNQRLDIIYDTFLNTQPASVRQLDEIFRQEQKDRVWNLNSDLLMQTWATPYRLDLYRIEHLKKLLRENNPIETEKFICEIEARFGYGSNLLVFITTLEGRAHLKEIFSQHINANCCSTNLRLMLARFYPEFEPAYRLDRVVEILGVRGETFNSSARYELPKDSQKIRFERNEKVYLAGIFDAQKIDYQVLDKFFGIDIRGKDKQCQKLIAALSDFVLKMERIVNKEPDKYPVLLDYIELMNCGDAIDICDKILIATLDNDLYQRWNRVQSKIVEMKNNHNAIQEFRQEFIIKGESTKYKNGKISLDTVQNVDSYNAVRETKLTNELSVYREQALELIKEYVRYFDEFGDKKANLESLVDQLFETEDLVKLREIGKEIRALVTDEFMSSRLKELVSKIDTLEQSVPVNVFYQVYGSDKVGKLTKEELAKEDAFFFKNFPETRSYITLYNAGYTDIVDLNLLSSYVAASTDDTKIDLGNKLFASYITTRNTQLARAIRNYINNLTQENLTAILKNISEHEVGKVSTDKSQTDNNVKILSILGMILNSIKGLTQSETKHYGTVLRSLNSQQLKNAYVLYLSKLGTLNFEGAKTQLRELCQYLDFEYKNQLLKNKMTSVSQVKAELKKYSDQIEGGRVRDAAIDLFNHSELPAQHVPNESLSQESINALDGLYGKLVAMYRFVVTNFDKDDPISYSAERILGHILSPSSIVEGELSYNKYLSDLEDEITNFITSNVPISLLDKSVKCGYLLDGLDMQRMRELRSLLDQAHKKNESNTNNPSVLLPLIKKVLDGDVDARVKLSEFDRGFSNYREAMAHAGNILEQIANLETVDKEDLINLITDLKILGQCFFDKENPPAWMPMVIASGECDFEKDEKIIADLITAVQKNEYAEEFVKYMVGKYDGQKALSNTAEQDKLAMKTKKKAACTRYASFSSVYNKIVNVDQKGVGIINKSEINNLSMGAVIPTEAKPMERFLTDSIQGLLDKAVNEFKTEKKDPTFAKELILAFGTDEQKLIFSTCEAEFIYYRVSQRVELALPKPRSNSPISGSNSRAKVTQEVRPDPINALNDLLESADPNFIKFDELIALRRYIAEYPGESVNIQRAFALLTKTKLVSTLSKDERSSSLIKEFTYAQLFADLRVDNANLYCNADKQKQAKLIKRYQSAYNVMYEVFPEYKRQADQTISKFVDDYIKIKLERPINVEIPCGNTFGAYVIGGENGIGTDDQRYETSIICDWYTKAAEYRETVTNFDREPIHDHPGIAIKLLKHVLDINAAQFHGLNEEQLLELNIASEMKWHYDSVMENGSVQQKQEAEALVQQFVDTYCKTIGARPISIEKNRVPCGPVYVEVLVAELAPQLMPTLKKANEEYELAYAKDVNPRAYIQKMIDDWILKFNEKIQGITRKTSTLDMVQLKKDLLDELKKLPTVLPEKSGVENKVKVFIELFNKTYSNIKEELFNPKNIWTWDKIEDTLNSEISSRFADKKEEFKSPIKRHEDQPIQQLVKCS